MLRPLALTLALMDPDPRFVTQDISPSSQPSLSEPQVANGTELRLHQGAPSPALLLEMRAGAEEDKQGPRAPMEGRPPAHWAHMPLSTALICVQSRPWEVPRGGRAPICTC